jgi:hypothetical protein
MLKLVSKDRVAFDAHRLIANLAVQGQCLSNQFHESLDKLRDMQTDRIER